MFLPDSAQPLLSGRHKPRSEYQPLAGDRHRPRLSWPGIANEPPLTALPVGDLRVLAEDDPIEPFLTDFAHVDTSLVRPGPASYAPRALAPSRTDLGGI
jgi:hypothetical protein